MAQDLVRTGEKGTGTFLHDGVNVCSLLHMSAFTALIVSD